MDLVTVLNTIHANASATYQDRIPEATRTNLEDIRMIIDELLVEERDHLDEKWFQ